MSAARFDLIKDYAIQNGGDYLLSLQFFDASNVAVAITGPVEFRLYNSPSGRGTPVHTVELTVSGNTAELLISEVDVNELKLQRCSYSIAQETVPILGGYCDVIPLATGAPQSTTPLRIIQNTQTIRISATNVLEAGSTSAVLYTVQSLSSGAQTQARTNINAAEKITPFLFPGATTPWTINHNLGRPLPPFRVLNSAGEQLIVSAEDQPGFNTTIINFNSPQSG